MPDLGERRIKLVLVSSEMLLRMFTCGPTVHFHVTEGLPEDTIIQNLYYEPRYNLFYVVVYHPSFDPVADGAPVPEFRPVVEVDYALASTPC